MNPNSRKHVKDENVLKLMIGKFLPYWPIFLILLAVALTTTFAYLKWAPPVYLSSTTILIQDEKKGAEDAKMVETFNFFSSKKTVENEIEVIHSRTLLGEVAKELNLTAPTFEKQQLKYLPVNKYTSAYLTSPINIEVSNIVKSDEAGKIDKVPFYFNPKSGDVKIYNTVYPLNRWVTTPFGTLRFIVNKKRIKDSKNELYFSLVNLNEKIESLVNQLTVTPVSKLSTIVKLEIEDEIPERGNDILNAITSAYYNSSVTDKNQMAANTLQFVDSRIALVKADLDSVEKKIQLYKVNAGIIDLSVQGRQFIENVSSNDQKISDINMQLAVLSQVEKYVVSKDNRAGIVPSTLGVTDPVLTNLLQKLYDSENEYEKLKRLTAENNPMLLSLAGQIEKIRPGILENIRNQRQGLIAGKSNVSSTNGSYNSTLSTIPQKEKALLDLTRQQNMISNVYTFLLQKREETALSYYSDIAENKIIDTAASSTKPVKPKKIIFYVAAFIFAICAGVALILIKDFFNNKILSRSQIESITMFPIIAEIGYEKTKSPIVISPGQRGPVMEQFRKLRATLSYFGITEAMKKILITSTVPDEGKSFVAVNLGLTLAIAGKKVVLLELDLINPSLSKKLNIQEERGITDYLQGRSEPWDLIKRTESHANLFIIPSGEQVDNPSELIVNGKIEHLFSYLEQEFDYIIVDTAPIFSLSDAYILSPLCDSTLYIVRHNLTPRVALQRLDENNQVNELKNVKIIFNSVKSRGFSRANYGYGYSYGYTDNVKR